MALPVQRMLAVVVLLMLNYRSVRCSTTTLTYSIDEQLPVGTDVCDVRSDAVWLADRHSPEVLNSLRFTILRQGTSTASSHFAIDETTGEIRIANVIDRETICPSVKSLTSCILRIDVAVHPVAYFQIIRAEVTVLDVNDNAPTFTSAAHQLTILESASVGSMFPLPAATDADIGDNGKIEYRLLQHGDDESDETSSNFRLVVGRHRRSAAEADDVQLKLVRHLDRELRDRYQLILLASDRGHVVQKTGSMTIDVIVGDVNDNAPRFERQSYEVNIPEDAPIGTTIVRMRATDPDSADNADIRFKFSMRTQTAYGNIFAIDPKVGDVILLQSLSYGPGDPVAVYQLSVVAEDGGLFPTPAHAALVVRVIDVNNHSPRIAVDATGSSASEFTASGGSTTQPEVSENSPAGTFVAHVTATDADTGSNGIVHCEIFTTNVGGGRLPPPDFRLVPVYEGEYQLVTAREFDREVSSRQYAAIRCSDSGAPPRSTVRNVTILISDQNDNAPLFTSEVYEATISENSQWGTVVTRVTAVDPDVGENGHVTYLLDRRSESASSSSVRRFHVDPDTGVVTTLVGMDREIADVIVIGVLASDAGSSSGGRQMSRAIVRVHVTDVDDESPTFVRDDYSFSVSENMAIGTSVGHVSAVDLDSPPYNAFSYRLDMEPDAAFFRIDQETGHLTTAAMLDRERRSVYRFSVVAQSDTVRARADTTSVTVRVADANDNAPTFVFPNTGNNTVIVAVKSPLHMVDGNDAGHLLVAVCEATDADEGANSQLTFDIADQGSYYPGPFRIDRTSGRVTMVTESVRLENDNGNTTYALTIRASDGGVPTLSRMETLHVIVVANSDVIESDDYRWITSFQSRDGSVVNKSSIGDQIVNWLSGSGVIVLGATLAGVATLVILLTIGICVVRSKRRFNGGRASSSSRRHPHQPLTKIELQSSAADPISGESTAHHPLLIGSTDPDKLRNGLTIQHFDSEPVRYVASPYGRMTSSLHDVSTKSTSNEHDTDSGCADISNSDDCGSSNGSNSSTEVCAAVGSGDPYASINGVDATRRQQLAGRNNLQLQATQSDIDRSLMTSPSGTLQLNAGGRKTVRFADDNAFPTSAVASRSELELGHTAADIAEYQPAPVSFRTFSQPQRHVGQQQRGVTSFLTHGVGGSCAQSDSGSPV